MGTSTAYGGPNGRTPLVPSWLGSGDGGASPPDTKNPDPATPAPGPLTPPDRPALPPISDPRRFTEARTNFTRYAKSGGSDRAGLGRAISRYVSAASGGARQATQRMGSSRGAGARLLSFLSNAQASGVREALKELNLESLAGKPIGEVFLGLVDYICPGAGTVDEGIAREAFLETIIDLTELGVTDLDELTTEQMETVFELYATHAIEARICNDIGTKIITMPSSAQAALHVQEQLRDFIRGAVSDALTAARTHTPTLSPGIIQTFVDTVYETSFEILQTMGDAEADQ